MVPQLLFFDTSFRTIDIYVIFLIVIAQAVLSYITIIVFRNYLELRLNNPVIAQLILFEVRC